MPSPRNTARNAIVAAVLLFVVVLATAILATLATPDSGGVGLDSYGVEAFGHRGIHDTLSALGIPVSRRTAPPLPDLPAVTLVLLGPNPSIVGFNSRYLTDLMPWVEAGGRVVVAPVPPRGSEACGRERKTACMPVKPVELTTILGLEGLEVVDDGPAVGETPKPDRSFFGRGRRVIEGLFRSGVTPDAWLTDVDCTGGWAEFADDIRRIALPAGRRLRLECGEHRPVATLVAAADADDGPPEAERPAGGDRSRRVIAAAFARGAGSIVVVADPALLANRFLGQSDNAVVGIRLLSGDSLPVVFDEFHHGLGPRGQPLWLATRPGYGIVAAGLLATALLVVWRQGTRLGPPMVERPVERRGIGEYLDAMGNLLSRGGGDKRTIVADIRDGIVHELNIQAGLPPEHDSLDRLEAALARRDPERARKAMAVIRDVDRALAGATWTDRRTLDTLRRLTQCL